MRNPICQIISDETFSALLSLNLLNQKALRDLEIKRRYLYLREHGYRSSEAIESLLEEYKYLQYDTVRKIIYGVRLPEER